MSSEYLRDTLHGYLKCRCRGNCVLKSLYVKEVVEGHAEIEAEPYDDAYGLLHFDETVDKLKRVIWRRRKSIFKALNADVVTISVHNEYTMQSAFYLTRESDKLIRVS